MIRKSKNKCKENTTNKLKSQTLSSKDWWSTLKSVISPNSKTSIPPLKKDDIIISDDLEKANALNEFFRDQSLISVENARLPQLVRYNVISELSTLTLIPTEIEAILKSLPPGKATGPDGIHNRVLRELATELSVPLTSLFNQSLHTGIFPECWKLSDVCPIPKLVIVLRCRIIVLFLFYVRLKNHLKELSSNTFTITFMIITYLPLYSLGSFPETRLSTNLPISIMLSVKLLTQEKKLELSFVTLARPLTVFGTKVFF